MTVLRRTLVVLLALVSSGLWLADPAAAADQSVFAYGDADFHGSTGTTLLNHPVVGMAARPDGNGYWLASREGRVFAFGDAAPLGSAAPTPTSPVVGIAATPSGKGYWLATAGGGVYTFGDAPFRGSVGPLPLQDPVAAIVRTPTGKGYWLVSQVGSVFTFGDAGYFGSLVRGMLDAPITGMAPTRTGQGYWLAARDGGVFAFGDADYHGSASTLPLSRSIASIAPTASGRGYWLVATDGGLFTYGDAAYLGSLGTGGLTEPTVGIEAAPSGDGYWVVTTGHLASSPTANPSQIVLHDGEHAVGDLGPAVPGTYQSLYGTSTCEWTRRGEDQQVIATGSPDTRAVVTVMPTDVAFETKGCAPFVNEPYSLRPDRSAPFGDGTWLVGGDIGAWHWTAPGGEDCTWARLSDFGGTAASIVEQDGAASAPIVALDPGDAGFLTQGCGTWTRR